MRPLARARGAVRGPAGSRAPFAIAFLSNLSEKRQTGGSDLRFLTSDSRVTISPNPSPSLSMITKNLGMLLLAIYLIGVGILGLVGMSLGILLPILALVAGILILLGK